MTTRLKASYTESTHIEATVSEANFLLSFHYHQFSALIFVEFVAAMVVASPLVQVQAQVTLDVCVIGALWKPYGSFNVNLTHLSLIPTYFNSIYRIGPNIRRPRL